MYNSEEFWKFQYLDSNCRSEIYSKFLGELTYPLRSSNCVFTHGDVHPTNIMVERDNEGKYHISGIIDWERSGFYPEDFECTKITNNLSSLETDDWYLYLPECIAPSRHPARWLADLTWDHYVV